MHTANKSKNRTGLIKISRILPKKFLLKRTKPFGENLPGTFYSAFNWPRFPLR